MEAEQKITLQQLESFLWDVSKVMDMDYMFYYAEEFNQDINRWKVSHVSSRHMMFEGALKFNRDISAWHE